MNLDKDKFLKACIAGDTKTIHDFLTNGFDVNTEFNTTLDSFEYKGITPLGVAACCGHVDIVKLLLLRNTIDINKRYLFKFKFSQFLGTSTIEKSIANNNQEIFNLLRSDLRIKNLHYCLLLAVTLYHGKRYIEFFLNLGISPNISLKVWRFETPLMTAAKWKIFENVKLLYEKGADINFVNEYGKTALDYVYDDTFVKNDEQALKISKFLISVGAVSGEYLSNKKNLKNTLEKVLPKNYDDQLLTLITNYTL